MTSVSTSRSERERLLHELDMLADLRRWLRCQVGPDVRLSTCTVDRVLDEYNATAAPPNTADGRG